VGTTEPVDCSWRSLRALDFNAWIPAHLPNRTPLTRADVMAAAGMGAN